MEDQKFRELSQEELENVIGGATFEFTANDKFYCRRDHSAFITVLENVSTNVPSHVVRVLITYLSDGRTVERTMIAYDVRDYRDGADFGPCGN